MSYITDTTDPFFQYSTDLDNPYDTKAQKMLENTDKRIHEFVLSCIIIKPRCWDLKLSNYPLELPWINDLHNRMEPFFVNHLEKILIQSIEHSTITIHFSKNINHRSFHLKCLDYLNPELSFRITPLGDIWILLLNKLAYSPTLKLLGMKKTVTLKTRNTYIKLLEKSTTNLIAPVLNITQVPNKKISNTSEDKYSMIVYRHTKSVREGLYLITKAPKDRFRIRFTLYLFTVYIDSWIKLVKSERIIHPNFCLDHLVYSINPNTSITAQFINFNHLSSHQFLPSTNLYDLSVIGSQIYDDLAYSFDQIFYPFWEIIQELEKYKENKLIANQLNQVLLHTLFSSNSAAVRSYSKSYHYLNACEWNKNFFLNTSLGHILNKYQTFSSKIKEICLHENFLKPDYTIYQK